MRNNVDSTEAKILDGFKGKKSIPGIEYEPRMESITNL
jgi:hypothetical protein